MAADTAASLLAIIDVLAMLIESCGQAFDRLYVIGSCRPAHPAAIPNMQRSLRRLHAEIETLGRAPRRKIGFITDEIANDLHVLISEAHYIVMGFADRYDGRVRGAPQPRLLGGRQLRPIVPGRRLRVVK